MMLVPRLNIDGKVQRLIIQGRDRKPFPQQYRLQLGQHSTGEVVLHKDCLPLIELLFIDQVNSIRSKVTQNLNVDSIKLLLQLHYPLLNGHEQVF